VQPLVIIILPIFNKLSEDHSKNYEQESVCAFNSDNIYRPDTNCSHASVSCNDLAEEEDLEEMLVTVELAGLEGLLYLDLRMAEMQMAVMAATPTADTDSVKLAAPTIVFPKAKKIYF